MPVQTRFSKVSSILVPYIAAGIFAIPACTDHNFQGNVAVSAKDGAVVPASSAAGAVESARTASRVNGTTSGSSTSPGSDAGSLSGAAIELQEPSATSSSSVSSGSGDTIARGKIRAHTLPKKKTQTSSQSK